MPGAMRGFTTILWSTLVAALTPGMAYGQTSSPAIGDLALVGGTIHHSPAEEPIRDGVVLIRGGKIVAVGARTTLQVPAATRTLDCSGLTIVAGFWNSHVHFFERKWANAATIPAPELGRQITGMLTRFGFTSVFDLSSMWENTRRLRDRIESGEVPGPRIRSTGEGLVCRGALPPEQVLNLMGLMKFPLPEIADAPGAAKVARALLDGGADGIKLFFKAGSSDTPSFPEGGVAAAVGEAHRRGKPVFAHPSTGADVLAAARGGVDVIAHTTPHSGPWDEETLATMKERRVALTPTLTLWRYYMRHDRTSAQEQVTRTAIGQLRAWVASGGTVLFGTDLGAVEYDPSEEYALMAEAGMSFRQILASLTTAPAEKFGESMHRGRIDPGMQADLVVLKNDPANDIRALTAVRYTLRAGKIIHRSSS